MSHADVTKWAKVCCQHLHSSDAEAPQNRFFTVEYDRKKLQEAVDSGEAAIEPLIRDFIRVAATVEMARGGRAVTFCETPAKCAHGCAFRIAKAVLRGKDDVCFSDIENLWDAIRDEESKLPLGRLSQTTDAATQDNRDKWLYDECWKGTVYGTIVSRLKKKPKSWDRIESVQGIKKAATRYAKRHGLPDIPKRK